ncbi:MAG: hypothetical protein AMK70_08805 [Nitrospira bacterium SG8_35_1]|nr:MAG: hypothetical protein AMK70_08805 [Nitrospira bacterium SG8_35_1]
MDRRTHERLPVNLKVEFYCNHREYFGTIINLSEEGMYITTNEMCFPFDSEFEVSLPLSEDMVNIHVKVKRITKSGECYDGIGVALVEPSEKYMDYVSSLKSTA